MEVIPDYKIRFFQKDNLQNKLLCTLVNCENQFGKYNITFFMKQSIENRKLHNRINIIATIIYKLQFLFVEYKDKKVPIVTHYGYGKYRLICNDKEVWFESYNELHSYMCSNYKCIEPLICWEIFLAEGAGTDEFYN